MTSRFCGGINCLKLINKYILRDKVQGKQRRILSSGKTTSFALNRAGCFPSRATSLSGGSLRGGPTAADYI